MVVKNINFYVQSIYEIGEEEKELNFYYEYSKLILEFYEKDSNFDLFFRSKNVEDKEKQKLLLQILPQNKIYFINFLLVIFKEMTEPQIKMTLQKFINKYNENHNIKNGIIWTIEPLDETVKDDLKKMYEEKINQKVFFDNKIDKELIGGMKITIDDRIWDYSIKNKLNRLSKELLGKGINNG